MDKIKTPLNIVDQLMSLRAQSWKLSKREDNLLNEIHSTILWRSEVDKRIDRLEKDLQAWKREQHQPEPKGAWKWVR